MSQRMDALELANDARMARKDVRQRLKTGALSLADALEDPVAREMSVWHLVKAIDGWGEHKMLGLAIDLERAGVSIHYGKRVRALTVRQRLALLTRVERRPTRKKPARQAKRKPTPRVRSPLVLNDPGGPPRCSACKIQMQQIPAGGLCGFCVAEQEQAA